MKLRRISEVDRRLDDHFSSLPSLSAARRRAKQSVSNWHVYAAALSSAAAMVTSASASVIGEPAADDIAEPGLAAVRQRQQFASSRTMPILKAVRRAMAHASRGAALAAPSITPKG